MPTVHKQLDYWYTSAAGLVLAEQEQKELDRIMPRYYGYYLLLLGNLRQIDWARTSPVLKKFYLVSEERESKQILIKGKFVALPFVNDSLDVVVLPHILEFCDDPKVLIDEVYRVLRPDGHIVMLSFNPYNLWSLRHMIKMQGVDYQIIKSALTMPWVMEQQFSRLNCQLLDKRTFYVSPKLTKKVTNRVFEILLTQYSSYFGRVYSKVFQKKVMPLTLKLKPVWWRRWLAGGKKLIQPTTRG